MSPTTNLSETLRTPKRILVTGAAGFIGNCCARELLRRGVQVVALVHSRPAANLVGATTVQGSIADPRSLSAALAGQGPFDAAIHCAGRASDLGRLSQFKQINVQGVINLIQAMPQVGISRLVHISTTDVYGLRDFTNADESTPLCRRPRNPYPCSKIRAEQAISSMLSPGQYVLLRPGAVWGEGDLTIMPRIIDYLRNCAWIIHFGKWRGQNRWPLAHVRNVATAAYLAAGCDEAAGEAYNVVDPEHTTMDQFYRLVIEHFLKGRKLPPSKTLPMWLGWPVGAISTGLSNLMHRDRPLFDPTLYSLSSVSHNLDFACDKLQRLFAAHGETFVTRDAGLAELAANLA